MLLNCKPDDDDDDDLDLLITCSLHSVQKVCKLGLGGLEWLWMLVSVLFEDHPGGQSNCLPPITWT